MPTIVELLSQHVAEGKPVIIVARTPCAIGEVFEMGGPEDEFIQNVRAVRATTEEEYRSAMSYIAEALGLLPLACDGMYFYEVESD